MCVIYPHYRLVDSYDAIWDMPEVEALSSGAIFPGLQVGNVVHLEGSREKDRGLIH